MNERVTAGFVAQLTLSIALLWAGAAGAQTTGDISGTVKDDTGGVLPGVEVTIANAETGVARTAFTDERGRYRVTNLNIGRYDVSAALSGFQSVVRTGIELTIGRQAVVDITLAIGEIADEVTVTGDAPLVDTRSGSMGGIVDRETILEIPLNGRDLTGLITLQAGTAMSTTTTEGGSQGYSTKFSISGGRVADNTILLDGTNVKSFDGGVPAGVSGNFLGGEAIQEFKVEKNAYSAEFGGGSGGVINVVSKSGTNEFHGSIYGFHRNDALDAANFRAPAVTDAEGNVVGKAKPDFWRAQYGASAGGRIIPNRTFYFANFEGLRERLGVIDFVTTFSADARQGILPGRTVPVNPAVAPYLDVWPLPSDAVDLGDGTARYSVSYQQPTDEDFYQVRVDHNFSESDAMYGRVTRQTSVRTNPQSITRWTTEEEVYNVFSTVEYRKILTNKLLNTFRFGFNRRGILNASFEDPAVDPGLLLVPEDKWLAPLGAERILGGLSVSGLTPVGLGRGWVDRNTNRFQFINSAVYTGGAHTLKFGVDWTHMRMGGDNPSRPGGELQFSSIDAFLRGTPRRFRGDWLPETDWNRNLRWNVIGSYVQDDFQVHPRLTLNLGLRHEFYTVPTERDGKIANLRNPLTDSEITILGTRGDSWWENGSFLNFAPRLGAAWDPAGTGRTAIRGGFGIFFNTIHSEAFRREAWRTAPFALETNLAAPEGVIPFPTGLYDFVVGLGAEQGDMFPFPYNPGNPRMLQWNTNVQRQIFGNFALTLGYAGSKGLELPDQVALNTAKAEIVNGRHVFPAGAARPNPAFNLDLESQQTVAESWYHSLQVEAQRRFSAGWQMQVAYTWAKSIDTASAFTGPTFVGDSQSGGYVHDRSLARGLSAFHIGHRLSASAVWQLPSVADGGWADALFGGWQVSGIVNVTDGPPISVSIGARGDLEALGLTSQRPDLVPEGDNNPVLGDPDQYFDVSQFAFPPARTIGNLGRNTLIAPGLATVDLGLTKNFQLGPTRTQFRVEIFNLLNRANLGLPANQVFDGRGRRTSGAGFIESTSTTARQIQLGVRVDW